MRSFISLQIKAPIIMKELLKHIIFDQREKDISQMIERDIDISLVSVSYIRYTKMWEIRTFAANTFAANRTRLLHEF